MQCTGAAEGGQCYLDHLPLLGMCFYVANGLCVCVCVCVCVCCVCVCVCVRGVCTWCVCVCVCVCEREREREEVQQCFEYMHSV